MPTLKHWLIATAIGGVVSIGDMVCNNDYSNYEASTEPSFYRAFRDVRVGNKIVEPPPRGVLDDIFRGEYKGYGVSVADYREAPEEKTQKGEFVYRSIQLVSHHHPPAKIAVIHSFYVGNDKSIDGLTVYDSNWKTACIFDRAHQETGGDTMMIQEALQLIRAAERSVVPPEKYMGQATIPSGQP